MACPTCKAIAAVLDAAGVPKSASKKVGKMAGTAIEKPVKRAIKRKASKWSRYMKNPRNQIKFKSGAKKGLLNMKAMAREYRRKNK